jgi:hypothetical protein
MGPAFLVVVLDLAFAVEADEALAYPTDEVPAPADAFAVVALPDGFAAVAPGVAAGCPRETTPLAGAPRAGLRRAGAAPPVASSGASGSWVS